MSMCPHTRRSGPMGLETAFFCHDSPLRVRCRTQIRLWDFDFDAGVLYWCSNGPAAEAGEVYLGNIGLKETVQCGSIVFFWRLFCV